MSYERTSTLAPTNLAPTRGLGRSGRLGRRGISPLIATVLLLAFAVAVGTMAVSYIVDATTSEPCDAITLAVQEGVPVCYRNGQVDVIFTNRGQDTIYSAMLKFVNANGDIAERTVPLSLEAAKSTKITVDYQTISISGVKLTITPAYIKDGRNVYCYNKEVVTSVQACG